MDRRRAFTHRSKNTASRLVFRRGSAESNKEALEDDRWDQDQLGDKKADAVSAGRGMWYAVRGKDQRFVGNGIVVDVQYSMVATAADEEESSLPNVGADDAVLIQKTLAMYRPHCRQCLATATATPSRLKCEKLDHTRLDWRVTTVIQRCQVDVRQGSKAMSIAWD